MLNYDKTDYVDMNDIQNTHMMLAGYFTGDNTALYHVPVLGDAPVSRYIKFKKLIMYTTEEFISPLDNKPRTHKVIDMGRTKQAIVHELANGIFLQEFNRIKIFKERQKLIASDPTYEIDKADRNGTKFVALDYLNEHMDEIFSRFENMNYNDAMAYVESLIMDNLEEKSSDFMKLLNEMGMFEESKSGELKYFSGFNINKNNVYDKLQEYFFNSVLATANIIQLTSVDLAWFDNAVDFQKRNKEIHASGTPLNTQATYNGERIGRDEERYLVFDDINEESNNEVINAVRTALDNNKVLSLSDKARIRAAYGDFTSIDKNGKK
jgi:hypothetical protein